MLSNSVITNNRICIFKGFWIFFPLQKNVAGYWRLGASANLIRSCFESDTTSKILSFHDWISEAVCRQTQNKAPIITIYHERMRYMNNNLDWPCVPRTRPMAFVDSTHDLPGFERFSRTNYTVLVENKNKLGPSRILYLNCGIYWIFCVVGRLSELALVVELFVFKFSVLVDFFFSLLPTQKNICVQKSHEKY